METSGVSGPVTVIGIVGPKGPTGLVQPPEYYIDGAKIAFSPVGIALVLLRSLPILDTSGEDKATHEAVAILRMSPQMAANLTQILNSSLQTLQKQFEEAEVPAAAAASPSE
jgi:hypothetical protein